MSKKLLNYGALASLGCAATFLFGMVLLVTQLMPYIDLQDNPEQAVNYVLEHYGLLSLWNFVIYVLFTKILYHRCSCRSHRRSQCLTVTE